MKRRRRDLRQFIDPGHRCGGFAMWRGP